MNIHLITPVNPEPIHQPIHRPLYVLFLLVNTSEYLHGPEGIHLDNGYPFPVAAIQAVFYSFLYNTQELTSLDVMQKL